MLGKLNIASLSLAVGAMGQYWFYGRSFSSIPAWIIVTILLLPWLITFTITLSKRPPFGPRPLRFCLLFVMCLYALLTISAEVLDLFLHLPQDGHFSVTAARIMMYVGLICFIPFIRAYALLRRSETSSFQGIPSAPSDKI
jgi:hypothetical protein